VGNAPLAYDVVFYVPTVAALLAGDRRKPAGGAETQVRLIARSLADLGLRTALVAFAHPGLPQRDGQVVVVARKPHSDNPVVEALRIAAVLRRVPSRAVVTRQAGAHTGLAALVARGSGRRFVYSAASVLDFDFAAHESHRLKRALYATGLRLADEIVAQTDEQRRLCWERLRRRAPVIRSIAEPAERSAVAGTAFLWAGRVVDYKQPLAYIDLAVAVPEARFTMVAVPDDGGDVGRRLYSEVTRRATSVPNLTLLPPCSRADLLTHIVSAVAVVSTSTTEGMPNIWLEGWSRGRPALTLAHDPDALIAGRGLGASAHGDPARLADAARRFWQRRDDLEELAERCVTYVQQEHAPAAVAERWRSVVTA